MAALFVEIVNGEQLPSSAQIDSLRSSLRELATRAEQDECQLAAASLSDDTNSTPDLYLGDIISSESSDSSQLLSGSPLSILQAAFPHLSTEALVVTLDRAEHDASAIDMEIIVECLLTKEYFRELEERGLDDSDLDNAMRDHEHPWKDVKSKESFRKPKTGTISGNRKNNKQTLITLGDVRQIQQAHARRGSGTRTAPAVDPWTQVLSIADRLASLLPPHPANFFQSCFHSPEYNTPYEAVCAVLSSIRASHSSEDEDLPSLLDLLDILLPAYENLDPHQRSRLIEDTQLALSVTQGRGEDALDLVTLLRDLDADFASGSLEIGIYHSRPRAPSPIKSSKVSVPKVVTPASRPTQEPSPPSPTKHKPNPFQWQSVPERKPPRNNTNHLAESIPAYGSSSRNVNGGRIKGSKGDVDELGISHAQNLRRRMRESLRKRDELLKEASKAWKKGSAKTRGGETALYYAEQVCSSSSRVRFASLLKLCFAGQTNSRGCEEGVPGGVESDG